MKARVTRGKPPKGNLRKDYRKALPELLRDFQRRCAYSMQHERFAGGLMHMEIDHHNPNLRPFYRNKYGNLFLSTRHCNNKKRKNWPKPVLQRAGVRFLNCCKEQDYGVHIFEDHSTHYLVGVTPAGKYHIRVCDLNAPHFVRERADRYAFDRLLNHTPAIVRSAVAAARILVVLNPILQDMIPLIPAPPGVST
jgi:hypothetical protein